jgi:hypothetical protein
MVVALASDADSCDSHAKVINFREAHIRRGYHAGEIALRSQSLLL